MALANLSHIESNQKWVLRQSGIEKAEKTKGSIRNLLDFNQIVKFARTEIHKCQSSTEAALYTSNLTKKYNHIKESIARQNPITRLFIKIILIFCRFHHNFNEFVLSYLSYRPDLSRVEKIQQELSTKTLKGGFTNAGNTCFIAAPLHCLNTMKELLPKHVDLMKKSKNETYTQFAKRQFAAEKILKLLADSDQGITSSGEKLQELRSILNDYEGGIPQGTGPGHTIDVMKALFKIFKFPHLQEVITLKNGKKITEKAQAIATSVVIFSEDEVPTGKGELKNFVLQEDGAYQPNNKEVSNLKGEAPLFIPVYVIRNHGPQVPIPNTLTFSNLKDCKYDLVSCQSGSENHAYTFVKSNGKWIKFDDASVGIVSDETALVEMGQGCDILIFRRSDPS